MTRRRGPSGGPAPAEEVEARSAPSDGGPPARPPGLAAVAAWLALLGLLMALALAVLWRVGYNPLGPAAAGPSPAALAGILLTAYSPGLAALAVAAWWPGGGGARPLLRRLLRLRVHPGWYVLALAGPTALVAGALAVSALLGGGSVLPALGLSAGVGVGPLVSGAFGEELGWRGFAQPAVQRRCGALLAALAVGLVWATWHLWPWLAPGGARLFSWSVLVATVVRMVSTSVVYGWLQDRTRGSLPVAMAAHTGHNVAVDVLGGAGTASLPLAIAYLAVAMVVAGPAGRRRRAHRAEEAGQAGRTAALP